MTKLTKFLLFLIVNALLIIVILYSFELLLKVSDPLREIQRIYGDKEKGIVVNREGWGTQNGKIVSTWGHPVRFNSFGIEGFSFRERNFDNPKKEGIFRIIVLGDSFTWGIGIPEEKRYTNILEKLLNDKFNSKKFEVLNFSVPGFSTKDEAGLLSNLKNWVQPDLIIIGFCINDPKPGPQGDSPERRNFEVRIRKLFGPFFKFMEWIGLPKLSSLINNSIWKIAELLNIIPTWQEVVDRAYNSNSPDWSNFLKALKVIKQISDELGAPPPIFAVLNHGTSSVKPTNYERPDKELRLYLKWWHQAERAAKKRGFLTCNVEEEIKKELSDIPLGVNKWDLHPSEKLHELYAREIFSLICDIIKKSEFMGESK